VVPLIPQADLPDPAVGTAHHPRHLINSELSLFSPDFPSPTRYGGRGVRVGDKIKVGRSADQD
jgi:hypothetical protein